jgi:hypothetical protein
MKLYTYWRSQASYACPRRRGARWCPSRRRPEPAPPWLSDATEIDVAQTLDKFAIPAAERAEVVAIVESTWRSIVAA